MKFLFALILIALLVTAGFGQKLTDVLATANNRTFTANELSDQAKEAYQKLPTMVSEARKQILAQILGGMLLEIEAKSRSTTLKAVVDAELAKVKDPAETEIKAVYDANQSQLGERTLDSVRKQIVDYLRQEPEEKAMKAFVDSLAAKYKVTNGKDVNAPDLKPVDVLFTIPGPPVRTFTAKEFDDRSKLTLYELQAGFYDDLVAELEETIYDTLISDEAHTEKIDAGDIIAREITSKLKDYTDQERMGLEDAFRTKLFTKYAVKILLKEPTPVAQSISVGDSPSQGPLAAPVTIVMFSDFQCSACSATHPILKKAIAAYPGKIRFVVRDFPLESVHANAFRAALAGMAAKNQGKFFEYIEVLYKNQNALDDKSLIKYATDLGLNAKQFELDLNAAKTAADVRKDMADGTSYGVGSTPTIFVNGVRVRELSETAFKKAIDRVLRKPATVPAK